jgi:hypothetical protein
MAKKSKKIDIKPDFVEIYVDKGPDVETLEGYICNKNGTTLGRLTFVKDNEDGSFVAKIKWEFSERK